MESLLVLVVLWVLGMPLLAFLLAYMARERARRLEARVAALERRTGVAAEPAAPAPAAAAVAPLARVAAAPPPAVVAPPPVAAQPQPPQAPAPLQPPPAAPSAAAARPARPTPATLEERIGVTWFTRIGAGVLLLGALYFFKYAVDNDWIGPWGRVGIGVLAGAAVLVFAEWQASRARAVYVQALVGVGLAVLYVSAYAAYGFYRLLPLLAAFAALAVVALLGGALAIRHRAQAVLVIALLAALANPVLLSTGDDLAGALFGYLLLVTLAVSLVASHLRFAAAPWLAVAGVVALWLRWYATFFKVGPPREDPVTGGALAGSAGAYFPLAPRLLPLAFVIAFAALWAWLAERARRHEWRALLPLPLLLVAVVAGQWGTGALLADRPSLLAAAMAAWGVAAAWLLRAQPDPSALAVPLLASFVFLLGRAAVARPQPLGTLLLAALWVAVYSLAAGARLRRAIPERLSRTAWGLIAATLTMGVLVAGALLNPDHPRLLALALLVVGASAAALATGPAPVWLAAPAAAASLLVLLAGAQRAEPVGGTFLPVVALWGCAWLAVAARRLLGAAPSGGEALAVLLALGGALGFVAIAFVATAAGDHGLRAVCAAAAGLAVFALGVAALRRRAGTEAAASTLLGGGLGLLTLAVGVAFSGVTITLVWALLAAAVAYLAARAGRRSWLAGAVVLFAVVLVRLLAIDALQPQRDHTLFMTSLGAEGRLAPAPLANPRALALAGVATALAVTAWACARRRDAAPWRKAGGGAVVLAHLLLIGLVISEVRLLVTLVPSLPAGGLGLEEFQSFYARYLSDVAAQGNRRAVSATLALGAYGGLLLGAGFAARSVLHRWLGLAALAVTLGKLVLYDVWALPRLYQVLVLVSVGALLLGAGFLYARFGPRLLSFLKNAAVAVAALALASSALALETRHHLRRAAVEVAAPGYVAVAVPPELYRASAATPSLADLRIAGPDGGEVGWLLRDEPAGEQPRTLPAALLDPVVLADGSAQAVLDLGSGERRHNTVALEIEGAQFLRRVRVEVSDDRAQWGEIGEGVVFRVAGGGERDERLEVGYPHSAARFLRVTALAVPGEEPVRIGGGSVRLVSEAFAEPVASVPLAVVRRVEQEKVRRSLVVLDAGGQGLPLAAVVVDTPVAAFERRVAIEATNREEYWQAVGYGVLFRAGAAENLRLPAPTAKRYVRLVIENGDNPPLPIAALRGEYRRAQVVFAATAAGRHTFFVGRDGLAAPHYDLAAVLARAGRAEITDARLGPLAANSAYSPEREEVKQPWTERRRVAIGVALGMVLLALALWALRLLRR